MSLLKPEVDSRLSLLVNGLETMSVDLDLVANAIKELDKQLESNAVSLQENWSDLVNVCSTSVAPIKEDIPPILTSSETIDLLTGNSIQSLACPSEQMVLNCFLNNVVQAIERNPGLEQAILQDLVTFCSVQGILLPYSQPLKEEDPSQPGKSTTEPENLKSTSQLWDSIRGQLSIGLWKVMSNLKLISKNQPCHDSHLQRLELLQSLRFLYPSQSVLKDYKEYRQEMVDKYASNPELLVELDLCIVSQYKDAPSNAVALAKFGRALEMMIYEDVKVMEVMFLETTLESKWIYKVYLARFALELRVVLQAYREEKRSISKRRGSSRSTSSMSIHGDDLVVYKLCFLTALSLEMTVTKMLEYHEMTRKGDSSKEKPRHVFKNSSSSSGRNQLPKLSHKSSNDSGSFAQAWPDMPLQFGVTMSDLPAAPSTSLLSSPWAWREEFKHVISRISAAVSETIKLGCDSSLEEQNQLYTSNKSIEVVPVRDELVGGQDDYPKRIAKSCSVIMSRGDEVLPLASSTGGKLFQVVRSSFVDTFDSSLKTYFSSIMKIINDFPKSCGIEVLYILLSSSVFIRNHLAHYENVIGTEPRRPFAVLHRQYSELVETLTNQIINYHNHIITMMILQDAESHNWRDLKSFYEDERCSFTVQMWNYHIQGVHHDLWKHCPPARSQAIFTELLHQSLSTFTLRYGHVIPSYNRVNQMRSDITALLLSYLSFMWSCCPSVAALLDSNYSKAPIVSIHNLCTCLLASMAVVTSPIDVLCKCITGKKKSKKESASLGPNDWLSWIHPEVLRNHEGSLAALPDRQAVYVLYKIMINQPGPNWPLILKALLFRNARIPVTIVKYGDLASLGKSDDNSKELAHSDHNKWFQEMSSPADAHSKKSSEGLVSSLHYVLFQCSQQTSALVNFLMALVSREDSLKLFESSNIKTLGKNESPVWLNCVFQILLPYMSRFLDGSIKRLCRQEKRGGRSFNFTHMSSLPCGCPSKRMAKSAEPRGKTESIFGALRDLLTSLADNLDSLPEVVFQFFSKLQESLRLKSIDTGKESAGIQVFTCLLHRFILDTDLVMEFSDTDISPSMGKTMQTFADVVWFVLTNQINQAGISDEQDLPIDLEGMVRSNQGWLAQKVQTITQLMTNKEYEDFQTESVFEEITELHYNNTAADLLRDKKGAAALVHIYKFLMENKSWLMNLILIPGHILPPEPTRHQSTKHDLDSFNPLQRHALIGEWAFDQQKIASFPFDWEVLLRSCLSLPSVTVRRLVCNRFEMQADAQLTDGEKEWVEKLKDYYGIAEVVAEESASAQVDDDVSDK